MIRRLPTDGKKLPIANKPTEVLPAAAEAPDPKKLPRERKPPAVTTKLALNKSTDVTMKRGVVKGDASAEDVAMKKLPRKKTPPTLTLKRGNNQSAKAAPVATSKAKAAKKK